MAKGTRIDEVEKALVELLRQKLPEVKTIKPVTAQDFDDNQDVIVEPPAILVLFKGELMDPRRDHLRLTYQSGQVFVILCGTRNLRSSGEERQAAHGLMNQADDALAGARLTLENSSQKPIVALGRADLWQFDANGTWYAREVTVESVAQFSSNAA